MNPLNPITPNRFFQCVAAAGAVLLTAAGANAQQSAVDNEAGFIMNNANGLMPGGDMQLVAVASSGFIGMFGGFGYWNSGLNCSLGETVTLGMSYFYDSTGGSPAFQYWASTGGPTVYSPVIDTTGGSITGNPFGAYYQIQNSPTFAANSGQALFSNISMNLGAVNSAVITPRVYNDIPGATGTYINNYPGSITLGESNVSQPTGFADRDVWQFSNNGSTPYSFSDGQFFTATMNVTITGNNPVPEPSTLALLCLGLVPVARRMTRRS